MRPLVRPPWEARFEGLDPALVAQHVFGPFCAACERHLPEGAVAWNADTGQSVGETATARDWSGLLPLCPNCAAAALAPVPRGSVNFAPLRPDRDATFALRATSPLAYELRPVAIYGDSSDAQVERVMVIPGSAAAAATIRRFALNTPFHIEPSADALVLPPGRTLAEVEGYDPRLARRTAAWHDAHGAVDALLEAGPEGRPAVLRTISWGVRFTGFWSVWASVLWQRLHDETVLDALRRQPELTATRFLA